MLRTPYFMIIFVCIFTTSNIIFAADISTFAPSPNTTCYMKGAIGKNDVAKLRRTISMCSTLMIDSPGGDLGTAMQIGRMIRENEMGVTVPEGGQCASACVFIYVSGVTRINFGPVAIHRPFLTNDDGSSLSSTQKKFDALGKEARQFLRFMNVRESLYEAMLAISPENSYVLGIDEMEQFGMGRTDPVWAELLDNAAAKRRGLTKQQYLALKVRIGKICGERTPVMPKETFECWEKYSPDPGAR